VEESVSVRVHVCEAQGQRQCYDVWTLLSCTLIQYKENMYILARSVFIMIIS
jgi:hypothetical protein